MAVQFGRDHVLVNAVCPGPILTPLLAGLFPNEEEKMKRLNRIPLGRFGLPEDIVYAALYLPRTNQPGRRARSSSSTAASR